ncbi:MAG: glutamate racemase [Atribacterota bacterium]
MDNQKIIGVIDSGVGGLSVVEAIKQLMPSQEIIYVADPLHFPYGEKTSIELMNLVRPFILFLQSCGVSVVVTACGTVSALCLEELRKEFSLPIVGILEPASRETIRITREKKVVILATHATVKAGTFGNVLRTMDSEIEIYEEAWPELIMAVERGDFNTLKWKKWVSQKFSLFHRRGIDTVILGCTHFALIWWFFEELAEGRLFIVNPAQACARELKEVLGVEFNARAQNGKISVFVRGNRASFQKTLQSIPLSLSNLEIASFPSPIALGEEVRYAR